MTLGTGVTGTTGKPASWAAFSGFTSDPMIVLPPASGGSSDGNTSCSWVKFGGQSRDLPATAPGSLVSWRIQRGRLPRQCRRLKEDLASRPSWRFYLPHPVFLALE